MTSTSRALAPTPLFPGQAAAPPGACDLTGMYLMHHAFRRDVTRFAAAVPLTSVDDTAAWSALRNWWRHVAHFLHDHHRKEDEVLWPVLRSRVDADGAAVLDAMEAEHELIDPLLADVDDGLERLATRTAPADRAPAVRATTAAAFTDLARVLDAHLAHEERAAVALVQRHLDGPEWAELERTGLAEKPAPPTLLFMLPWLADGLRPEDLAPLLSGAAAAPLRVLLGLGRRRYDRLARRAFAPLGGSR